MTKRFLLAATALLAIPAAASPPPVPMAQADSRPDAICLPPPGSTTVSADALIEQAATAIDAGNSQQAEELLRSAVKANGYQSTRARALRMLIDLRAPKGDLDEVERILACGKLQGEDWSHARAWLALRQGRYQDAVDLLAPHVLPRHHMSRRWPLIHENLGDAYAKLGRRPDAQAQWRIALATEYGPSGTGWDRAATEKKLAADIAAGGAEPLLPLQRYHDAVSILDVGSVERTDEGVRYSKVVLLLNDENGTAFGIDSYEADCDEERSRVTGVRKFNAAGEQVELIDTPTSWLPDRPGEPWLPTERKLVCSIDPDMPLAPRHATNLEMLRDYRAGGSGL